MFKASGVRLQGPPGSNMVKHGHQALLTMWQIAGSDGMDSLKHPVLGFHMISTGTFSHFLPTKSPLLSVSTQRFFGVDIKAAEPSLPALLVKLPSTRSHHPLSEPRQIRRIFLLGSFPIARARHAIQAHVAAIGKQTLIVKVWPLCQLLLSHGHGHYTVIRHCTASLHESHGLPGGSHESFGGAECLSSLPWKPLSFAMSTILVPLPSGPQGSSSPASTAGSSSSAVGKLHADTAWSSFTVMSLHRKKCLSQ